MYVPAEVVYYELMFGMGEASLDEYSKRKKVILVSPNTLHLTLRVIEHWFRDMTVAKETREIIKRLGTIVADGEKLGESYQRLGKHLGNAQGAYEDTGKRISLLSGRVKKVISLDDGDKKT
jgi:DNA recombination protein RmuC